MEQRGEREFTPSAGYPIWMRTFLSALAEMGVVRYACSAANVSAPIVYARKKDTPEFAEAWMVALDNAADRLEEEAIRRGRDGIVENVVGKDGVVYENRKYSDTLLIFLLKGARPEKYRERFDTKVSGTLDVVAAVSAAHTAALTGEGE